MQASGLKVLVIDDEDAMREVLGLRLRRWGYRVSRVASAVEGWQQMAHFQPDIVICAVVMPDESGLELVNRASREESEAAFIMITAHGTVDIAVEAMKNGAFDFLTKPLDYKKRLAVLRAAEAEGHRACRCATWAPSWRRAEDSESWLDRVMKCCRFTN